MIPTKRALIVPRTKAQDPRHWRPNPHTDVWAWEPRRDIVPRRRVGQPGTEAYLGALEADEDGAHLRVETWLQHWLPRYDHVLVVRGDPDLESYLETHPERRRIQFRTIKSLSAREIVRHQILHAARRRRNKDLGITSSSLAPVFPLRIRVGSARGELVRTFPGHERVVGAYKIPGETLSGPRSRACSGTWCAARTTPDGYSIVWIGVVDPWLRSRRAAAGIHGDGRSLLRENEISAAISGWKAARETTA